LPELAKVVEKRHFENVMKTKIAIVILAVICVGLLIALLATKKQSDDLHMSDTDTILDFSNQLTTANTSLDDLRQVNLMLTNDVVTTHQALDSVSNNLVSTTATLDATKASLESAQGQITNLNTQISDLEAQNKVLDERADTLSNTIVTLDSQITDTQQKLATAETNNTFLAFELQKQMAQKAELQRKFNDIDEVRAQVKKLRDELFVARRLQWMNEGISPGTQPKGAQLLMQHPTTTSAKVIPINHPPQYDLNVEVGSDGSVHVLPPDTNSPAR
jgi:peptidoglycan hydrolase CwlO-like protein